MGADSWPPPTVMGSSMRSRTTATASVRSGGPWHATEAVGGYPRLAVLQPRNACVRSTGVVSDDVRCLIICICKDLGLATLAIEKILRRQTIMELESSLVRGAHS